MNNGTYEERLPCGGTLRVSKHDWEIRYYFPGPDRRHNGTFVNVPGRSVKAYAIAFEENFHQYVKLQEVIPRDGNFSTPGKQGMTIHVGRFWQGVCIQSHHMPLGTSAAVKKVTDSYHYAEQRAAKIQEFLISL